MNQDDLSNSKELFGREVAKSAGKELSKAAGELLVRSLGPAADEVGLFLRDEFRAWSWRRRNVDKVALLNAEEMERRGQKIEQLNHLPEGDAYRVFEACSLEDNETVQKLWAGLIASAMDPKRSVSASKVFVELLKSIGPAEAGLLLVLYNIDTVRIAHSSHTATAFAEAQKEARKIIDVMAEKLWRKHGKEDQRNAIQNLMRLRCVGFRTGKQLSKDKLLANAPFGVSKHQVPASAEAVASIVDHLENLVLSASGTGSFPIERPLNGPPEAIYQLTSLGQSLVKGCLAEDGSFPV